MDDGRVMDDSGIVVPSLENVLKFYALNIDNDVYGDSCVITLTHFCHQNIDDESNWTQRYPLVLDVERKKDTPIPFVNVFEDLMEHAVQCLNPDGSFKNRD